MFVVITHHVCKAGDVENARERIDKNGGAMTGEPGFLFRYRIGTASAPDVVSTLTVWKAEGDYQAYRNKRNYGHPASSPYQRIETQTYEVQSEHLAASA
jgi:heme-degrading monooxygenase HmoA